MERISENDSLSPNLRANLFLRAHKVEREFNVTTGYGYVIDQIIDIYLIRRFQIDISPAYDRGLFGIDLGIIDGNGYNDSQHKLNLQSV